MYKPGIGITIGDPSGAGPEICLKALQNEGVSEICRPVLIGDERVIRRVLPLVNRNIKLNLMRGTDGFEQGKVNIISPGCMDGDYEFGRVQAKCGAAAYEYIKKAAGLALGGEIDAVVTGPINKEALNKAGFHYSGHTEIFAELTGTREYAMLLTGGPLKVIHVTTHMSMRNACDSIKMDRVHTVIKLANQAAGELGIRSPRIAVAGLNPHCGENGLFGDEETREIAPAVEKAMGEGICVQGPLPPDTVFLRCINGEFDIVAAMYHDQGHIPLKLLNFMGGVNITVGLPIIRTSVDHGTVFDKAGGGTADEGSMIEAIKTACLIAKNKRDGQTASI